MYIHTDWKGNYSEFNENYSEECTTIDYSDTSIWITRDKEVIKIKDLSETHMQNIDEMYKAKFMRLLKIKWRLFLLKFKKS